MPLFPLIFLLLQQRGKCEIVLGTWLAVWRRGEGEAQKQWILARDRSRIMLETRWRVEMCTYLLCVSFSFEGLPLNGNFRDNNVNVYTLYCHRFEHYACLLSCWQRKRCHVEQCGAVYLNRLLSFHWKFTLVKSTRLESFQRDHGERVRFTSEASSWKYWSVLFHCGRKGAIILFCQDTQWGNEGSSFP